MNRKELVTRQSSSRFEFQPSQSTPFCGDIPVLTIRETDENGKVKRSTPFISNRIDNKNVILPRYMHLTQRRIDTWLKLSDKEKARWALMTEDVWKITPHSREAKYACLVNKPGETPKFESIDKQPPSREALNHADLLIDVYGTDRVVVPNGLSVLERDRWFFKLKRHQMFDAIHGPDGTLSSDTKGLYGKVQVTKPDVVGKEYVPPTLLHYKIIAEAFRGYVFRNSVGMGGKETCAIMGGGVVAPLTAWIDETVRERFDQSMVLGIIDRPESDEDYLSTEQFYVHERRKLVVYLNDEFIDCLARNNSDPVSKEVRYEEIRQNPGIPTYLVDHAWGCLPMRKKKSNYAKGDVDIFIQPGITETKLHQYLEREFNELDSNGPILSLIDKFVGGNTNVTHLGAFFKSLAKNELKPAYDYAKNADLCHGTDNIVSVTRRAITNEFVSGVEGIDWCDTDPVKTIELWPRITQAIQLEQRSNLLLALFDFDLGVCKAADTGNSVMVAPVCALALMTGLSVFTPAVIKERRCIKRRNKYDVRGFPGTLLDAYDFRTACTLTNDQITPTKAPVDFMNDEEKMIYVQPDLRHGHSLSHILPVIGSAKLQAKINRDTAILSFVDRPQTNQYSGGPTGLTGLIITEEVHEYQEKHGFVWVCGHNHDDNSWNDRRYSLYLWPGTMEEKIKFCCTTLGDLWTPQLDMRIGNSDPRSLVACGRMKTEYHAIATVELWKRKGILVGDDDMVKESTQDGLGDELGCYGWNANDSGTANRMGHCFYSGPTSNMAHARTGTTKDVIRSRYKAKELCDRMVANRKCIMNGLSPIAARYLARFNFGSGSNLNELILRMHKTTWPRKNVRPIGLNPERMAIPCSRANCKGDWRDMIGTSSEQSVCRACWNGGCYALGSTMEGRGKIYRTQVILSVCAGGVESVEEVFRISYDDCVGNENIWFFYLCIDGAKVNPSNNFEMSRAEMFECHKKKVEKVKLISGVVYKAQLNEYEKDKHLPQGDVYFYRKMLGGAYLRTMMRDYEIRWEETRSREARKCERENWSFDVVGEVVIKMRQEHARWLGEYNKLTVKDLKKWKSVYEGDIHLSMMDVEKMIRKLNNIMRRRVITLEVDREFRNLTVEEIEAVQYCRNELGMNCE